MNIASEEWTEMDIEDLKSATEHCRSIEEVAAAAQGLKLPPNPRSHRSVSA
jgi:hypothetical protein